MENNKDEFTAPEIKDEELDGASGGSSRFIIPMKPEIPQDLPYASAEMAQEQLKEFEKAQVKLDYLLNKKNNFL